MDHYNKINKLMVYSEKTKRLSLSAMFLTIGIVLPFITMNIKVLGKAFLPMHYPVIFCGIICGDYYGLFVGFLLPLVRSFLVGTPTLYPTAIAMSFELASYGFMIGFLYSNSKYKCLFSLYKCLIITMIFGRVVWGIVYFLLTKLIGQEFTAYMFVTSAFMSSIPGMIMQLIIIPLIVVMIVKLL